ncbi:hypothetical protein IAS59_004288 [Cryptococcus gattii]
MLLHRPEVHGIQTVELGGKGAELELCVPWSYKGATGDPRGYHGTRGRGRDEHEQDADLPRPYPQPLDKILSQKCSLSLNKPDGNVNFLHQKLKG